MPEWNFPCPDCEKQPEWEEQIDGECECGKEYHWEYSEWQCTGEPTAWYWTTYWGERW